MNRLLPARPLVIAHRGASGYRPEHSRSAYELALAQGADAVEPDIVATRDGVLVLRHENEISGTTDVAAHGEFADRRTTKEIDGRRLTGWFTEDFTWEELRTLRVTERLPRLRGTDFDGREGILRLRDLLELLDRDERSEAGVARADAVQQDAVRVAPGMVAEIKHASYFESVGLPLDELFAAELRAAGWTDHSRLIVECFETTVLGKIKSRGVRARYVFLVESSGAPADQVARFGSDARSFADHLTDTGLTELASAFDGVSVDKHLLLAADARGHVTGTTDLVQRAHRAGLAVFCWTLRAENQFLAKNFRRPGGAAVYGDWEAEFGLLLRSGLDGVFADQPDLAIRARAAVDQSR